ncbi:MAG: DUF1579 domain-containing protein [Ferruginibacter sp.]|nr:DUF1579 domain-containing protein [Chitinophagaceae bacterium]
MKRLTLILCTASLLFFACNSEKKTDEKTDNSSDTASKTDEKNPESFTMPDSATMMKNWETYMTPGDMHAMLAKSNGTWTTEVTSWMDPEKPPMKSTGSAVNKMIMGGRYQESVNSGDMMGMPFEGRSITGYDNAKKVFFSSWIDNMGTGIMMMEGPWDEATKTITMKGKGMDPMVLRESNYKQTFKIIDDNNQFMEMYGPGMDGKEYKMMEIKFTRK